ncbi:MULTISPECIES: preprotein translocase subunit YajC [Bacillaceae]|uniref:Preprotein translocase subunit YajC n=1 Tax=Metabacillus endolithicus TaxID=1535204 RepID=A0ABW5BY43_9BACI|nr:MULTISPECIES: preprotein translocase subunit YajC [Bacillaceae]MCM3164999.1 preprotein translocase subunit YajC [Metabacillus litoralis]MCM3413094.1 preprotein translocase subunit YajC [Metabacillus litoralis]PGT80637.1 preprotein translocase subunit YajC [Bacillus sp. AFS040349]UGB29649.1 preprotein translocase subunit YajC [Metabacillus sp. B2-18]UHA62364.1 preprotein translocase subunit YajC [Metabacillus litoralis]
MEMLGTVLPLVLMFAIFYFLLIRPQQKQQKAVREMQNSLQKGDKIVTIGGLHGILDSVDENKIVLKVGDGTRLTFDRKSVREVIKD